MGLDSRRKQQRLDPFNGNPPLLEPSQHGAEDHHPTGETKTGRGEASLSFCCVVVPSVHGPFGRISIPGRARQTDRPADSVSENEAEVE
ncbi:hypothetical protein Q5P01_020944 [Channa striata]|uniref:Uncharacterized protein n=1 Tax=Channa striata TaxID=64152 RepID=A0AA88LZM2_CHASR|nr:hypothetical protein Q5P01_020944 [Channa striata]